MSKYVGEPKKIPTRYCPCCFLDDKLTKLKLDGDENWDCKECGNTFVWPSTLISEDTVRTYVQMHPEHAHWLKEL